VTAGQGWLLDANVIREFRPGGHANVAAWRAGVPASDLYLSAVTVLELRRGFERLKARDPARAARGLTALDALAADFADRIVPVDAAVATEWARLLGGKDKDRLDVALAATARVRGLVVVTRNVRDFRGRGVRVLDPFKALPAIVDV
jgi:toxin FitB